MKLSIGELEKLTGMNRTALRYYDAEGVLDPERQENGYRMYSEEDVMSLVQLKQLSAFGVELSELPGTRRSTDVRDVHRVLVGKEQSIEQEIEELYQKLSRLRLHVNAFGACASGETRIEEGRMVGAYRLYYSSAQADSSKVSRIFKRWMNAVPDTYSVVRIPARAMDMPPETLCPVDTGIGLLSGAFHRIQETYEEPMEYTPPCKCLHAMITVKHLNQIPSSTLAPFRRYLDQHGLIALGDFYGWVVYSPANHQSDAFHISIRLGIN